jgi:hypothetical protein
VVVVDLGDPAHRDLVEISAAGWQPVQQAVGVDDEKTPVGAPIRSLHERSPAVEHDLRVPRGRVDDEEAAGLAGSELSGHVPILPHPRA